MRLVGTILVFAIAAIWISTTAVADEPTHVKLVSEYEGTKTCVVCHEVAAKDVARSLHYQQAGEAPFLKGWEKGKLVGMINTY